MKGLLPKNRLIVGIIFMILSVLLLCATILAYSEVYSFGGEHWVKADEMVTSFWCGIGAWIFGVAGALSIMKAYYEISGKLK